MLVRGAAPGAGKSGVADFTSFLKRRDPLRGPELRGRLGSALPGPWPILWIAAALQKDPRCRIGAALTTSDGEFVLTLAEPSASGAQVVLTLEDGAGEVVGRRVLRSGAETAPILIRVSRRRLAAARPVGEERPPPPLILAGRLAHQEGQLRDLVEAGRLPAGALAAHQAALRPLRWLADLYRDAEAVLEGDRHAALRWRGGLIGFGGSASLGREGRIAVSPGGALDPDAVSILVTATAWAARDAGEEKRLFEGLAAALAAEALFDQVAIMLARDRIASLAAFLSYPPAQLMDLDFGGVIPVPDIPIPGGDIPFPGGDGWPNDYWRPKWEIFLLEKLGWMLPGAPETCFDRGRRDAAALRDSAPRYRIDRLSNPRACPGDFLTLYGSGLGTGGSADFPSGPSRVSAQIIFWSDDRIALVVPPDATAGPISLSILVGHVSICRLLQAVYRSGESWADFEGGVVAFYAVSVSQTVEPGGTITATFRTNEGPAAGVDVFLRSGATLLDQRLGLPGGTHKLTFKAPSAATLQTLRLDIVVRAACGPPFTSSHDILVIRRAGLVIEGIEVVQAIQRFDLNGVRNDVKLCANRNTIARVYLRSTVDGGFDYGPGPGLLPNVTGTLRCVALDGTDLGAAVPLNGPILARPQGATVRTQLNHTLNFRLPAAVLSGPVRLVAGVRASGPGWSYEDSDVDTIATFVPRPVRNLVQLLVRDDLLGLAAPTAGDYAASVGAAAVRYPVPDGGFILHPSGAPANLVGTMRDLRVKEGWEELLDDIEEIADDSDFGDDFIWSALTPNSPAYGPNGIGRPYSETTVLGLVIDDTHACCASQMGLPATFAHELGHCFGFHHSACADSGKLPENIDAGLPARTEDLGVNVGTVTAVLANTGELMSYCGAQARWPSIVFWERMFDR